MPIPEAGPRVRNSVIAAVVCAGLFATPVHAEEVSGDQLVDALNAIFGKHAKTRGSHAKGVCVKGTFTPAKEAAALSKAPFLASPVPVLGRFSFGGGSPAPNEKAKSARGLAVRFDPDGKAATDFVMLSAPIFFARTPQEVVAFLQARAPGPDGKPDPAKVKAFGEAHPWTGKQAAWVAARPVPASYAGLAYHSIHAFTVTSADGMAFVVKFMLEPGAGELGLTEEEAKAKPDGFFSADLDERLAKGPVSFSLVAIEGTSADPVDDPTAEWPEAERRKIPLGDLAITSKEADATCDATTFDPNNLAEGIAGQPGDKILPARGTAYAVSLTRRSQ